jgi:hypothetical protein
MSWRGLYSRYLKLLEKWPLDPTKKGRDLGEELRKRIAVEFSPDNASKLNADTCEGHLRSLTRIATNHHKNMNPRIFSSSATGMDLETCRQVVSNEFLDNIQRENSTARRFLDNLPFKKRDESKE